MTDWESIKNRYRGGGVSLRALAQEEGLDYRKLCARARKEGWSEKSSEPLMRKKRIDRVSEKLLKKIEDAIDGGAKMDSREIKTMTGALKELRELQKPDGAEEGTEKRLEVCFLGDTEELSR